ncbi:hypothetical protein [Desulfosporosinus burensis]
MRKRVNESEVNVIEKRICPVCNNSAYSSDPANIWICPYCGAEIPYQAEAK